MFSLVIIVISLILFLTPRGHVTLFVNVASQWGFADKNYTQLVYMHNKYSQSKGLRILAFPCNQFGGQVCVINKINAFANFGGSYL